MGSFKPQEPQMERIETLILSNLVLNEQFTRKTLPFVEKEYFQERSEKIVFEMIDLYFTKYNDSPTREALIITLDEMKLAGPDVESCHEVIKDIFEPHEQNNLEWLVDECEKFCKDKSIYNAILESIQIIDGKSKEKDTHSLPKLLSDALAVSFDLNIGHDYLKDAEDRYDFYHQKQIKIPFDLEYMNKITNGGVGPKTLNVVMAGTGVGKSLFMCHHASNCLVQGKNVLYITCEMAEERIAERIDANLMDISMDDMKELSKKVYARKLYDATKNIQGGLLIKEYPTATANVNHIRHLLEEIKIKKSFIPDIIFVDYLNICASVRYKQGNTINSYTLIKAIAEELRGLAVENNIPIFTATQTNRQGFSSSDVGLEDTSESFGLPATADFMFALIATEELDENNQVLIKQLKNRYNDLATNRKFVLGIDRSKMKLYEVDDEDQPGLLQSGVQEIINDTFTDKFKKSESNLGAWSI
jgi:replicative DNA helicase